MMQKLNSLFFLIIISLLSGCYPVDTVSLFDDNIDYAESHSRPIYLTFRDNKDSSFYFLLSKESEESYYKLIVRWQNPNKSDLLFDGERTSLKFMVDRQNVYSFHPVKKTKVVSYDINSGGKEEEGVFEIPHAVFREIAYAKYISVQLKGRAKTVIGEFNRLNTKKAFRDFYENSY